jgi:tetraacyldisaccharide 4'-kinase
MRAPDFWNIRHGRDAAPMLRLFLTPLGWLYGASVARRLAKATPLRLPVPVISVGNISLGGTGKTPLVLALHKMLKELMDGEIAILSRGYGGTLVDPTLVEPRIHIAEQTGDEPLMMSAHAPVFVAHDRAAGGQFAVDHKMAAILLDDAHQNPGLVKDLSIVVVDGETGFGNGRLVPAGPLREPVATGLARADLVITMGPVSEDTRADLDGYDGPILAADLVPAPTKITGKVVGFCGIGRPEKFDATLRDLGLDVVDMFPFPDHYKYSKADIDRITKVAQEAGATLVTTQKDYVRLPYNSNDNVRVIAVTAVLQDQDALRAILMATLDRAAGRA